ncbi:hypothetical protein [Bremerella cremea]|nr:hypothetical protein [Bremerella cremea]
MNPAKQRFLRLVPVLLSVIVLFLGIVCIFLSASFADNVEPSYSWLEQKASAQRLEDSYGASFVEGSNDGVEYTSAKKGAIYCEGELKNTTLNETAFTYCRALRLKRITLDHCHVETKGRSFSELTTIEELYVISTPLTGNGLSEIVKMPSLKAVSLSSIDNVESIIPMLSKSKSIELLILYDVKINNEAAKSILKWSQLKGLRAISCQFASHTVHTIVKASNLESIQLPESKFNPSELADLSMLRSLRVLNLMKTPIQDKDLSAVGRLPHLEKLYLQSTAISDEGIAHLIDLPNLQLISMNHTKVTKRALDLLGKIPDLNRQFVYADNTAISEADLEQFRRAKP